MFAFTMKKFDHESDHPIEFYQFSGNESIDGSDGKILYTSFSIHYILDAIVMVDWRAMLKSQLNFETWILIFLLRQSIRFSDFYSILVNSTVRLNLLNSSLKFNCDGFNVPLKLFSLNHVCLCYPYHELYAMNSMQFLQCKELYAMNC